MGVNLPKLRAFMKREGHHLFDTIWNINLPEGVTVIKSGTPYCFDCFWNLHLTESYAFTKCILSNRCHSFLYDHLVNLRLLSSQGHLYRNYVLSKSGISPLPDIVMVLLSLLIVHLISVPRIGFWMSGNGPYSTAATFR